MDRLRLLFTSIFSQEPTSVQPITGSASNRQYYRLSGGESSCIGVIGTDVKENFTFLSLAKHFAAKDINAADNNGDGVRIIKVFVQSKTSGLWSV